MLLKQSVQRVGDDLLGRAAVHRACQAQLQVAARIEAQRERGLGLAPGAERGRGARRGAGDRTDGGNRRLHRSDEPRLRLKLGVVVGVERRFGVGLIDFGGLVERLRSSPSSSRRSGRRSRPAALWTGDWTGVRPVG